MIVWRPPENIRVKAIGLAWRENSLLAAEVENDDGTIKGVRPLGGSIDFGETREQALMREFLEELGAPIEISGPWHVFENIYNHEGALGHEIVFAANIEFVNKRLYNQDEITFAEDNGLECKAKWFAMDELSSLKLELYPNGLNNLLLSLA